MGVLGGGGGSGDGVLGVLFKNVVVVVLVILAGERVIGYEREKGKNTT